MTRGTYSEARHTRALVSDAGRASVGTPVAQPFRELLQEAERRLGEDRAGPEHRRGAHLA
jgi:hypothetical protein